MQGSVRQGGRDGHAFLHEALSETGPRIEDGVVAQCSVCAFTLYRVVLPNPWGESARVLPNMFNRKAMHAEEASVFALVYPVVVEQEQL
jgi:hypothetical protein